MTSKDRNPQATAAAKANIEEQINLLTNELAEANSTALKAVIEKVILGLETMDIENMSFAIWFNDVLSVYYLLSKKDTKYLAGDEIYFIPPEQVELVTSKLEFECLSGNPSISIGGIKETILSFKDYDLDESSLKRLCETWENKVAYVHDGDFAKLVRIHKDKYILWINPELLVPETE